MLSSIVIIFLFPKTSEFKSEEDEDDNDYVSSTESQGSQEYGTETGVTLTKLLKDSRFIMAGIGSTLSYF